jgi:hypothetical protein
MAATAIIASSRKDGSSIAALEIRLMREMGANILRLGHYQQRALVLDLCDELGLFVWEELCWCRSGVVSEKFQDFGRRKLRTLINQHRNHPSILIWGLGNEDDWPTEINVNDHEAIRRYMPELRDLAHTEDPTCMTGYRRGDFVKDIPDVYSLSMWAGWYSGVYKDYGAALEKVRSTVPYSPHVEWGADSHAGRFAGEADPAGKGLDNEPGVGAGRASRDGTWTETYACDLFDWYLKTIDATPWLAGALRWVFKDFTTPLRVENPVPRLNQKGLLTRDMRPREGYFVFQSWWSQKPMLRLFGHDWPVRWGYELRAVARARGGQKLTGTLRSRYETRSWGQDGEALAQTVAMEPRRICRRGRTPGCLRRALPGLPRAGALRTRRRRPDDRQSWYAHRVARGPACQWPRADYRADERSRGVARFFAGSCSRLSES